jgi:hypothetical protein
MPKPLIRIGISELGGLAWTAGFELQAMCWLLWWWTLIRRALFDFGLWFLKGTGGLIALNCDHDMFILSNGRALFDFWLWFLRWTGVADPFILFIKVFGIQKNFISSDLGVRNSSSPEKSQSKIKQCTSIRKNKHIMITVQSNQSSSPL